VGGLLVIGSVPLRGILGLREPVFKKKKKKTPIILVSSNLHIENYSKKQ
jgi:hypothetical protein